MPRWTSRRRRILPRSDTRGGHGSTPPPAAQVAVLGGGLAGLAAAVMLARAGADVQLLESTRRVGGRVKTLREPFSDGLYAEAGGEFISAGHETALDFLRQYDIPVDRLPGGERIFSLSGRIRRGAWFGELGDEEREDARVIERGILELARHIQNPQQPWTSPGAAELDSRSLGEWFDGLGLGPAARTFQQAWVSVDYGVPPEKISLLQYARDERLLQLAPRGEGVRVRGGMDCLPLAMAAELGRRVHLGRRVVALQVETGSVMVRYERDGRPEQLRAESAICALPANAVDNLCFDPPLAPKRAQALRDLAYGSVARVFLQFRDRFWRGLGLNGGGFTDGILQATYEPTFGQAGERGILTVYTADDAARRLASLAEEQRIGTCLRELERLYPGCSDAFERGASAIYAGRPGGTLAYSHFRPGQLTRLGPLLARPEGRIHFAGEHTDSWQATMNGALASGVRAAREVLGDAIEIS